MPPPLQVDSIFVFILQVAVLFRHHNIFIYLFARWHLFRHVGYIRHQQQVDLWPFDLESGVRVTCDMGYHSVNFSLPRPVCSRVTTDVRDRRQTKASLNASALWERRHNNVSTARSQIFLTVPSSRGRGISGSSQQYHGGDPLVRR